MIQEREFYKELKDANFKNITYGIYNKMDDDGYIKFLEKKYKKPFSIDDFKYYDFFLEDKEKFLIKMYNSKYLENIKKLNDKISDNINMKLYIDHDKGSIRIVKLIN